MFLDEKIEGQREKQPVQGHTATHSVEKLGLELKSLYEFVVEFAKYSSALHIVHLTTEGLIILPG